MQSMAQPVQKALSDDAGTETSPLASAAGAARLQRDDFDRDVWCVLGLPLDIVAIDGAISQVDAAVRDRQSLSFVTPNVNWLVRALRDPQARREIIDADLSLIDGAPLLAFARLLGAPAPSRVAGSDLFDALRRRPSFAERKLRVYFFGGRDGAAEKAAAALDEENGPLAAAGWRNPGFGDVEEMSAEEHIDAINKANPDFVVVSLGAAKGQAWIDRNKERLNAPVTAHLGAVVDFAAGGVARAPAFMRRLGLEGLWRIKEEPALWRRYFDDGTALAGLLLSRLAPQMRAASVVEPEAQGRALLEAGGPIATIRLVGALGRVNLQTVREVFRAAAAHEGDVRLDFARLERFDRAFLGMVLMLEKALTRNGRRLYVDGASPAHQKLLRANEMRYSQSVQDGQEHCCAPEGETKSAAAPQDRARSGDATFPSTQFPAPSLKRNNDSNDSNRNR